MLEVQWDIVNEYMEELEDNPVEEVEKGIKVVDSLKGQEVQGGVNQ